MGQQKFDPRIHHRKSIRLQGFDYSRSGAYFVTIVARGREFLYGEVVDGVMDLNDFGKIAEEFWRAIPEHFPHVDLGAHIIMPNHVHGIISIRNDESTTEGRPNGSPLPQPTRAPRDQNAVRWGRSLDHTKWR